MSDFSKTVKKFSKKFGIDSLVVVEKTSFDILAAFIEETPRDTGRAASSWNLTKDKISLKVSPESAHPKGSTNIIPGVIDVHTSKSDLKKKSVTFYITNNLKYIVPLSRGHSKRAPNGWIERIVKNYINFLKKQVK